MLEYQIIALAGQLIGPLAIFDDFFVLPRGGIVLAIVDGYTAFEPPVAQAFSTSREMPASGLACRRRFVCAT